MVASKILFPINFNIYIGVLILKSLKEIILFTFRERVFTTEYYWCDILLMYIYELSMITFHIVIKGLLKVFEIARGSILEV